MPTFRKKPIEFEAMQWTGDLEAMAEFAGRSFRTAPHGHEAQLWVEKSLAWCGLALGSWVVRENDGVSFYPIVDEILTSLADPVNPDEVTNRVGDSWQCVGAIQLTDRLLVRCTGAAGHPFDHGDDYGVHWPLHGG